MTYPVIWWGWTPRMQLIPFSDDPLGHLGMFIIPGLILGTALSAATMRMTRTMMLEVLRQDYIRTAWSKGLRERVVVIRHAVKNALIPVVTRATPSQVWGPSAWGTPQGHHQRGWFTFCSGCGARSRSAPLAAWSCWA